MEPWYPHVPALMSCILVRVNFSSCLSTLHYNVTLDYMALEPRRQEQRWQKPWQIEMQINICKQCAWMDREDSRCTPQQQYKPLQQQMEEVCTVCTVFTMVTVTVTVLLTVTVTVTVTVVKTVQTVQTVNKEKSVSLFQLKNWTVSTVCTVFTTVTVTVTVTVSSNSDCDSDRCKNCTNRPNFFHLK